MYFFIKQLRTSLLSTAALSVAFTLVVAGCSSSGDSGLGTIVPTKYLVTISSTDTSATVSDSCVAGAIVTIKAGVPSSGSSFKKWTTNSSGVNFANVDSAVTTFTMPANAVAITADIGGDTATTKSHILSVKANPIAVSGSRREYRESLYGKGIITTEILLVIVLSITLSIAFVVIVLLCLIERIGNCTGCKLKEQDVTRDKLNGAVTPINVRESPTVLQDNCVNVMKNEISGIISRELKHERKRLKQKTNGIVQTLCFILSTGLVFLFFSIFCYLSHDASYPLREFVMLLQSCVIIIGIIVVCVLMKKGVSL